MTGMPDTALSTYEITRTYQAGTESVTALDGVSLSFARGSMTAIVGPSGSGKSTLMLCAAGLEPSDSGSVVINGHDLATMSGRQRAQMWRQEIAFIFQEYNLVPSLSAALNVRLPSIFRREPITQSVVMDALDAVGIAQVASRRPGQMSGGQQQRVAIARALAMKPAVLFADEPTGALDTHNSERVMRLLRRMCDEDGVCVLIVTHNPEVAAVADRVVFLRDGRVWDDRAGMDADAIARRLTQTQPS